ncbi:relaxase/mobilization nuclease domain-containing protein [Jatrophihabitans lederbergiae]|uniref:MobA/VirD2-like nuclease domain-containing protein n=1 Tax=Jatrophihabitans lederbergiae TaxID=3075547 RepID=A0ABU2JBS4_9ACTN|nr:hypothetical protein [Jatrophihabitans sp. DSM 44399]MDT0262440.1 hypothetical protein [Jatrophihabitans sp. DSM 44399]
MFRGKSPYGLVRYLYGEGRRNEHTDAHMIASWDGNPARLEPEFIEGLDMHNVAPLVRQLEQPVRACDRAPKEWVYHLVFRNAPEDRRLSDEEWAQVCTAAMERTGIAPEGDPAGCRWVAVRHADDHVHVVATLAREDGRAPNVWRDYPRLAEVRHEFEDKFGLRSTAPRDDNTAAARPGVKEQLTAEAKGRRTSPRVTLRQKVKTAAASSYGFADFTDRLAAQGVTVWPRMSERNPEQITGYSVSLNDWRNAAGEPVRFGGGKLAPDLSWPKLRARWEPAPATGQRETPAGGAGWHARSGAPLGGSLTGDDAEQVWREAERIVREAADKISADADAGTDPDAAADAAWAASDTLSGAAAGLEGDAGGPITDAAEAFDRAGRERYRRVPARSDTGTALRSAGRMMALLAPGTKHPGAQVAALTVALAALAAAVADLRQSQQRLHQAEAALASAEQLRHVAPGPQKATTTATRRSKNAADLAAMSFSSKPFRVRPTKATPDAQKKAAAAAEELRRRGDGQGRGPTRS